MRGQDQLQTKSSLTLNHTPLSHAGVHKINSPSFTFHGFKDSTDEEIAIGSKHRIVIPSGATCYTSRGRLSYLTPAPHTFAGKVGLAWDNGSPMLLETGRTYNIDSPTFR